MKKELDEILTELAFHRPKTAYLGRAEMKALKDRARQEGCSIDSADYTGSAAPVEYCGVPIYEVLAENHVGYIPRENDSAQGLRDSVTHSETPKDAQNEK